MFIVSRVTLNATLAVTICAAAAACNREQPAAPATTSPAASAPAQQAGPLPPPAVPLSALPKIDSAAVLDTIKKMSSDKFQGRAPGTVGEQITVGYLEM